MKSCFFLLICVTLIASFHTASAQQSFSLEQAELCFVKNNGQLRDSEGKPCPQIEYMAEANGIRFFFSKQGVSYVFLEREAAQPNSKKDRIRDKVLEAEDAEVLRAQLVARDMRTHKVDMNIVGGSAGMTMVAGGREKYYRNYYLDSPEGIRNVPTFRTLTYKNVYDRIDLVFYAGKQGLKYDLIVHPGGKVSDIRFRYTGAEDISLSAAGTLRIKTPLGVLEEHKPFTYQEKGPIVNSKKDATLGASTHGRRAEVASNFRVANNEVRFDVAHFDGREKLVIDPGIRWSTYMGGTNTDWMGDRMVVDPSGYIVVVGRSLGFGFPLTTTATGSFPGICTFIAKFTKGGQLVWSTFFGGHANQEGSDFGIDSSGNIFVVGQTYSSSIPVTAGAFQPSFGGVVDVYLAKFNSAGMLLWSTFYGGSDFDGNSTGTPLLGLAVDSEQNVIISGHTESTDFPVTSGAFQTTNAGSRDAFVVKFSGSGQRLWGTYLGGSLSGLTEGASCVAVDKNDNILVAGTTPSPDFPVTSGAFQTTKSVFDDAFITKLSKDGSTVIWSTFYGGNGHDDAHSIALDSSGNIIVVGKAGSNTTAFPVSSSAFQATPQGGQECFIVKLDSNGQRQWATLYGGSGDDRATNVVITSTNAMYVCGYTSSTNFSITADAYQTAHAGSNDAFIFLLDSQGQRVFASYLGGSGNDGANAVALDDDGNPLIAGFSTSTSLSVSVTAFQPQNRGPFNLNSSGDVFLVKFGPCSLAPPVITAKVVGNVCGVGTINAITLDAGEYSVYRWSNGATTRTITITQNGVYTVTVADQEGCSATSAPKSITFP